MRPPRRTQSPLHTPLNRILGTQANVRILRVLSGTREIAAGELAHRAALSRPGVYPALAALEEAGVVSFVGAGTQRLVRLRRSHPLTRAISALFRAEARRVDQLVSSLREVSQALRPLPMAVWLEPRSPDSAVGDDTTLVCYVLDVADRISTITNELATRIVPIEQAADVAIEVRGITRSDLVVLRRDVANSEESILLAGIPPDTLISRTTQRNERAIRSHDDLDARSRRLAIAVGEKIKRDPDAISRARRYLTTRIQQASNRELPELLEWERMLTTISPSRLRRFLADPGERATRLRQTLPFLDVLTPGERKAVLTATTDAEARTAVTGRPPGRARGRPNREA